ncbi:hypothetical protein GGG16DRAFT_104609 [Schizophyllum commune]
MEKRRTALSSQAEARHQIRGVPFTAPIAIEVDEGTRNERLKSDLRRAGGNRCTEDRYMRGSTPRATRARPIKELGLGGDWVVPRICADWPYPPPLSHAHLRWVVCFLPLLGRTDAILTAGFWINAAPTSVPAPSYASYMAGSFKPSPQLYFIGNSASHLIRNMSSLSLSSDSKLFTIPTTSGGTSRPTVHPGHLEGSHDELPDGELALIEARPNSGERFGKPFKVGIGLDTLDQYFTKPDEDFNWPYEVLINLLDIRVVFTIHEE